MSDDYKPIPCELYSQYELCIMHRSRMRVYWHDGTGVDHCETLCPLDLKTQSGAEFMIARNRHNGTEKIRLDRIARAVEL